MKLADLRVRKYAACIGVPLLVIKFAFAWGRGSK